MCLVKLIFFIIDSSKVLFRNTPTVTLFKIKKAIKHVFTGFTLVCIQNVQENIKGRVIFVTLPNNKTFFFENSVKSLSKRNWA